jgi:alcohol dehydrogenase class IV
MSGQAAPEGAYGGTRQRVTFGPGSLTGLRDVLDELNVGRCLLVSGRSIASGELGRAVAEHAGDRLAGVFDGTVAHAPRDAARAGHAALRDAKADGVVSVGGGSSVDVARGILLLEALGDFANLPGDRALHDTPTLPFVAVPTTLSQAEYSYVAGITNEESEEKELYFDLGVMPDWVLLDAEATLHTPRTLWLSSGVKALDTSIDIYLQFLSSQPFWDPLALGAAADLVRLLREAGDDRDVATRQRLLVAAWTGEYPRFHLPTDRNATPATRWFGAAARHQLGGRFRAPHSEISGVLLPASLAFHLDETRERQEALAVALGVDSAEQLPEHVRELVLSLGLPTTLGELGIGADQMPAVVEAIVNELPALGDRRDEMLRVLTGLV